MSDIDLAYASIEELGRLYRRRKVSPVEVTELMLARIERLNPSVNAYLTVTAEVALGEAAKAEAELFGSRGRKGRTDRGPLHGIPISLKDNIYTKGIRTTAGSKILKDFVPTENAVVWSKLKNAGAILLGKTNLHEFAYGVTTNNPHYGPTRNPWDLKRIPGGSSGGSAAAVASGLCYGSIGTDTGGSVRIPAALCGVVGIKPSLGFVPASKEDGVIPLSSTLDSVGTLARSVGDASLLLDPIFRPDKRHVTHQSLRKAERRRGKLRVGVLKEFIPILSDEVGRLFAETLHEMEKNGTTVVETSIPLLHDVEETGNTIAWAEATNYHQSMGWFPDRAVEYGADVRSRLETGDKVSAPRYLRALGNRQKFIAQARSVLADAKLDILAIPTTPMTAPLIGEESTEIRKEAHPTRALLLRLNRPANLSGFPAVSVPCGFTPAGLPVGLQLISLMAMDESAISSARYVESLRGKSARAPLG